MKFIYICHSCIIVLPTIDYSNSHCVTVPSPMVSLSPLQSSPYYIDGNITLQCQASISSFIDTPVLSIFTWRKNNGTVLTNTTRLTIVTDSQAYQSTLTITGLSLEIDTDQSYSCEVILVPDNPSTYVLRSMPSVSPSFRFSPVCKLSIIFMYEWLYQ